MDIFGVVGNSLGLIKKHPKFLFPALIIYIAMLVVGTIIAALVIAGIAAHAISFPITSSTDLVHAYLPLAAAILITVMVAGLLAGAYVNGTYIALASQSASSNASISPALKRASERYFDLLIYSALVLVVRIIIALALLGPVAYIGYHSLLRPYIEGMPISWPSATGFIALAAVFGIIYLIVQLVASIMLSMGGPAVVLDGKGPSQALIRSIAIGKKDFSRLAGFLVIVFIVAVVINAIGGLLGIIPLIGFILSFAADIVAFTFMQLAVPMYYIYFHTLPRRRAATQ
jgi:hypothetical protein